MQKDHDYYKNIEKQKQVRNKKMTNDQSQSSNFDHRLPNPIHRTWKGLPDQDNCERFERPRYRPTELEKILVAYVAQKTTRNPLTFKWCVKRIDGLTEKVDAYITLLEQCEEKTPTKENDKSFSYFCVITKFHGYSPAEAIPNQDPTQTYQKLHELETIGLVDGKRFSFQLTTTPHVFEYGELAVPMNDKIKQITARSYITTDLGKEKLRKHRVAKNAHS